MRIFSHRSFLPAVICASLFAAAPAFASAFNSDLDGAAVRRNQVAAPGLSLPLVFIQNQGQFNIESAFQVRLPRLSMSIQQDGWTLRGASNFSMRFDTSGEPAMVQGLEPLRATASYFRGGSAKKDLTGVSTYGRVRVSGLKPGVDLELFSKAGLLEYDVLLAPGVPASEAVFTLEGVQSSCLNADGELISMVDGRELRQRRPVSFQVEADGTRRPIESRFVELGENRFGFALSGRDLSCSVVIDPVLVYSEFVGGSNADVAEGVVIDAAGDMYVAGWSKSADFPGQRTRVKSPVRGRDAVVFKLSGDGSELLYVAFVGGSSDDEARALVVDDEGQVTVVGSTKSSDFPASSEAAGSRRAGGFDAFAFQLASNGRELNWCTFIGGSGDDFAHAVALAEGGTTIIAGATRSTDFPTSNFALQPEHNGGRDGFAVRLGERGRLLLYSTYLGGSRDEEVHGVALDSMGNAYLVGQTDSPDFPVSDAAFDLRRNSVDAFVTKLGRAGSSIVYSTFVGGNGSDGAHAVALDSRDQVWFAGSTTGSSFPVTEDAAQPNAGGAGDGFLARLSISGSKLEYATFLGGSGMDQVLGLGIDAFDSPWVTGVTRSDDFLLSADAAGKQRMGGSDSFLTSFDGASGQLNFSSYLGMAGDEEGRALAVQPGTESVVVVGFADDIEPVERGPMSGSSRGPSDALVARYEAGLCSEKAQLTDLGGAAGLNVSLTRPRLGSPFELTVSGAPPLAKGLLVYSPGKARAGDLEGLAVLHLDPERLIVMSRFVADNEGKWSLSGRLSNRAELCGTSIALQVFTLERRYGPLSFGQASQGLEITFGY